MLSAIKWVPRGVAAEFPKKVEMDDEEADRIAQLAQTEIDEAEDELAEARGDGANPPIADRRAADGVPDEYNMDDYDHEDDDSAGLGSIANVRGLAFHAPDESDEYLTLPTEQDLEEERDELRIQPTDNLVLTTKTEDEVSYLEVYVYDDSTDNTGAALYVHHDIMLPSFPLCVEWVGVQPGSEGIQGNFAAIGTFEPEIELWDLDTVDGMYPAAILGQVPKDADITKAKGTGKKKKKLRQANADYHVDAVLSLSANKQHANLLASGSADTTVKLWDLTTLKSVKSFDHHTSKVSSVAWNPVEGSVLLSGGYDHYARVADLRADDVKSASRNFKVIGDVESVLWHANGRDFFVATDQGSVYKFDARAEGKPVWTLQAHDTEISTFDINSYAPDLMLTGSTDKTIKLWNLSNDKPSMLLSRDLDVGKVFAARFAPDAQVSGLVAAGGSEGKLKTWNAFSNRAIRDAVAKGYSGSTRDEVTTADNDWEDDDEEADDVEDVPQDDDGVEDETSEGMSENDD